MSSVIDRVRDVVATREEIAFAVVFGSAAEDRLGPTSDVDIAVRFEPGRAPEGWEFGGVVAALESAVGRRVDLVDLARVSSTVLRMEIGKGKLVKGSHDELVRFKVRAFRDWREFGPRFKRLARAMAAAVAGAPETKR